MSWSNSRIVIITANVDMQLHYEDFSRYSLCFTLKSWIFNSALLLN